MKQQVAIRASTDTFFIGHWEFLPCVDAVAQQDSKLYVHWNTLLEILREWDIYNTDDLLELIQEHGESQCVFIIYLSLSAPKLFTKQYWRMRDD